MSRVRSSFGYTIVESMIFLTITGMLLASVILLMGGHQQKSEFSSAVMDLDSKIQSVIGNVATGYYNNTGQTKCTLDSSGHIVTLDNSGPAGSQGTNSGCVFIGQVIIFPAVNENDVTVFSVAGLRNKAGTLQTALNLQESEPVLFNSTREKYVLGNGAVLKSVKYKNGGVTNDMATIGIITSFAGISPSGSLSSGAAYTNLLALIGNDESSVNGELNNAIPSERMNPESIEICITDNSQDGLITISGGSTKVEIRKSLC